MQTKPRYIGNAKLGKLLAKYACPYPFHVVRAMMMGDIASPLMGSPTSTVESLWDEELPEFATPEEAQTFFGGLLGFWNHLARHQKRSHPFKLINSRPSSDREVLKEHCVMRLEEIHALLEGFFQGEEELDLPPELAGCVETLEGSGEMYASAMQMLEDKSIPCTEEDLVKLRNNLGRVLEIANRESARLVWVSADYRKSQLSEDSSSTTLH